MERTPRMERHTVFLAAPQSERLKRDAERLGITVSDLIRRIIDQHRDGK